MSNLLVTRLPRLTRDNLSEIMAQRLDECRNPVTSIPMLWQGLVEMELQVGRHIRTATLYIPNNTPQGTSFVLLNIPRGEHTVDFLQKSGWLALADRNPICLFAAEPGDQGWMTPEEEQDYIHACFQAVFDGDYFRGGMSLYIVGYGDIGICLHKEVLGKPLKVAAAAFLNASDVDAAYLQNMESASMDADGMEFGLPLKDAPVPVWILGKRMTAEAQAAAGHWIRAIGAGEPEADPILGTVYNQAKDFPGTPGGKVIRVAVKEADAAFHDRKTTDEICRFLLSYVRFTKTGPYGSTLTRSIDYETLGVETRYFPDENGNLRECLIYVPKAHRSKGKLPLVFAIHGANESVRNYFEESLWYQKAQEAGFIVVMPETTLYPMPDMLSGGIPKAYRPRWKHLFLTPEDRSALQDEDILYFDRILNTIIAEYPVDESRIYCTGHSNGCMMTNFFGSSPLGKRFAALAATSGVVGSWDPSGSDHIPIWVTMGEFDLWSYGLAEDTSVTAIMDKWLVRNRIADTETVRQIRISGATEYLSDGRHRGTIWKNAQGIPMVRYDWIEKKDHMNTPEENFRFWDQWFSKWCLTEEHVRCYEGSPV